MYICGGGSLVFYSQRPSHWKRWWEVANLMGKQSSTVDSFLKEWICRYFITLSQAMCVQFKNPASLIAPPKYFIPEAASNQTWGQTFYWQDHSEKNQRNFSSLWFAVINCGFPPKKISSNKNPVLLSLSHMFTWHTLHVLRDSRALWAFGAKWNGRPLENNRWTSAPHFGKRRCSEQEGLH